MGDLTPTEVLSWPKPNFVDPESRRGIILATEIPLTVVMTVFMAARMYSRWRLKALGVDDWTMLLCWMMGTAICIINCYSTLWGTGLHVWDNKLEWIPTSGRLALATQMLFGPCVGLTKFSLCLTYLRIFPSQGNRYFCYATMAWLITWTIAIFFTFLFQCIPISDNWDLLKFTNRNCINQKAFFIAAAATNSFTDIAVFLWPARFLWNIQLPKSQRVGLVVSFSLGCIVCVAGICRIWYLNIYFGSSDVSWEGSIVYVITTIETNVGIICGCITGIKPILSTLFPRLFGSTQGKYSSDRTKSYGKRSFPFQSLPEGSVNLKSETGNSGGITVRQDIELTRYTPSSAGGDGRSEPASAGRSGSEEWIFDPRGRPTGPAGAMKV
ncbi:hypothetical protein BU16DRAFT_447843 [Lophium mytilinum]|uniref:Rhodopsin domain-containing protein n=1 Tax=Lophium mytilinum TaxID=390894 RepID=A0A6A6REA4_9PEZI|nr:hypothetical protein BU16DRAFT_447843 [Lophium mytilinum]